MSAWSDFVTASLLGTDKGGALPAIPAALQEVLGPAASLERAAQFLTRAGAFALWRRAGWKPVRSEAALASVAPPETGGALVNPASAAHLRAMLSGHCAEVLPEWLGVATEKQRRLPPEWLPALLDRARQNRGLRPLVMAAGGARVRWLAGLNPDWNFAADDSPEHWETGGREQRLAILRGWRASQPAEAREKLEAVWSAEPADTRTAFLGALADGLSDDDAPFLERALDDRSKEVRQNAVDLLARLPGSPLVARMLARAKPLLTFKRGGLLARASLEVALPPDPDAAALRDGLDPKAFGSQKLLGEKSVLLTLIVSAIPLRHWTDSFQQSPAELLKAAKKSEFADALSTGWALAAFRQRDAVWAEALLDAPVAPFQDLLSNRSLFNLLPEPVRAARLVASLRSGILAEQNHYSAWQALTSQFGSFEGYLPASVATELIVTMHHLPANEGRLSWLWTTARAWFLKLPPSLLPTAIEGWSTGNTDVATLVALVELLSFRRDALAALAQP